ncbi:MAG: hypothetical protein LWX11_03985 [Firmicutes bacterium]|nr:hypothetical protein [Bacillota bacterium]
MIRLEGQRGRLHLTLVALPLGADLCVTLTGGDREHIGAVALAHPDMPPQVLTVPHHREAELALELAQRLALHFRCAVSLTCGIHLDGLQPQEIEEALSLGRELVRQLKDSKN